MMSSNRTLEELNCNQFLVEFVIGLYQPLKFNSWLSRPFPITGT